MSKPRQHSLLSQLVQTTLRLGHYLPSPIRTHFYWWLFRRPFLHRRGVEQLAILGQGKPFLVPSGPYLLRGYRYGESGPSVILTHGWQGSAASWYRLIPLLRGAGFSVVTFDAPGHSGRPRLATLPLYAQGLADVAALFSPVYALIGHSFGGMASARVARELPELQALVILGTPDRVSCLVDGFLQKTGLQGSAREQFERQLKLASPVPVEQEVTSLYLRGLSCAVRVFHDEEDDVVPLGDGQRIAQAAGLEPIVTSGLGHRGIIRDEATLAQVVEFLRNPSKDVKANGSTGAAAALPPS